MPLTRHIRILTIAFMSMFMAHVATGQKYFQEGFVVNVNQDTTWGLVKIQGSNSSPTGCYFKATAKAQAAKLTMDEIIAFGITQYRTFKTISLQGNKVFAQILVKGEASLYSIGKAFYLERNTELYELNVKATTVYKKEVATHVHTSKRYIGRLKATLDDCPEIHPDIDGARLSESSLVSLLEKYNTCVGADHKVYKKDIPWFKLSPEVSGGMAYSTASTEVASAFKSTFGFYEDLDFAKFRPIFGMGVAVSSPRVNNNLALTLEAFYIRNEFRDQATAPIATFDHNDVTFQYTSLIIPIGVRYRIDLTSKAALYVRAGIISTYFSNTEFVNVQSQSDNPGVPPRTTDRFEFYPDQQGITLSLGSAFRVGKIRVFCEPRYMNVGSVINSGTVGMNNNLYIVTMGASF